MSASKPEQGKNRRDDGLIAPKRSGYTSAMMDLGR